VGLSTKIISLAKNILLLNLFADSNLYSYYRKKAKKRDLFIISLLCLMENGARTGNKYYNRYFPKTC